MRYSAKYMIPNTSVVAVLRWSRKNSLRAFDVDARGQRRDLVKAHASQLRVVRISKLAMEIRKLLAAHKQFRASMINGWYDILEVLPETMTITPEQLIALAVFHPSIGSSCLIQSMVKSTL